MNFICCWGFQIFPWWYFFYRPTHICLSFANACEKKTNIWMYRATHGAIRQQLNHIFGIKWIVEEEERRRVCYNKHEGVCFGHLCLMPTIFLLVFTKSVKGTYCVMNQHTNQRNSIKQMVTIKSRMIQIMQFF